MQATVQSIVDGDTTWYVTPSGARFKDRAAATASLESNDYMGKASAKGKDQTARVKTYLRPGDVLEVGDLQEKGAFGRPLTSPTKVFNGQDVDMNFLKTALGDNNYYTNYGKSEDSHENLKGGYSTWLPYQFSDEVPELSQEDFDRIDKALPEINGYINNMKGGELQEQRLFLDTLIGNTFGGDGREKVAAYMQVKKRKELQDGLADEGLTPRKIMAQAFADPRMQEEWDRSVIARQGSGDIRLAHKKKRTFTEKAGAALQLYNDMSNYVDRDALFMSQHSQLKVTDEVLSGALANIPLELQGIVSDEAKKYGNERAFVKAIQLREDIEDRSIFDDMSMMEQFGYGAVAYLSSLGSATVGLKGYQAANAATRVVRAWDTNKVIKGLAITGAWTGAALADGVVMEGPRLLGDATYTPEEMIVDVALDTGIGAALPLLAVGGSALVKPHLKKYLAERAATKIKNTKELEKNLTNVNTRKTTEKTFDEQLNAGIKRRETVRQPDREVQQSDVHISTSGGVIEPDVPPIGERRAVVGEDGVARPAGEADAERSASIGRTTEGFDEWSKGDYSAAKKAGVRLEHRSNWTDEDAAKFNKAYLKQPKEGDLTPAEIDAKRSQEAAEDLIDGGWIESGLEEAHMLARKFVGTIGKVGQGLGNLTGKAMSHKLQDSKNPVMRFLGHVLLEDPSGYAGNMRRHGTAAMTARREKNKGLSMILPNYARTIEKWGNSKGLGKWETFKAKWGTSKNPKAKQFEDEFIDAINARKMGRSTDGVNPHILTMLDDWGKFTDYMGTKALEEKLPGWSKLRTNYFPQIRDNQLMANTMKKGGVDAEIAIQTLFEKGISSSREAGLHELDNAAIKDLAEKIVKQGKTGQKDLPESSSSKLGRAQGRVEMDWSVEHSGYKLSDFLQTDIAMTVDKYTSDLGGRLALNKVTGGKVVTDSDLQGLRDVAFAKHAEALEGLDAKSASKLDKAFNKETQLMDDTFNMVLGRPARGGLAPELRHLKDFTSLTRMGILGTSQSIESGNIIARSTMDLFNDPDTLKHLMAMDPRSPEGRVLLDDVMNITGRTRDMEYLHRPSQVLDEETIKSHDGLRRLSIMMADQATAGDLKQPASRLLGKTSMFNWVQRHQSEYVQKSFLIHTDRYFTTGKSSITPARMVDLGLINRDGTNTELAKVFNEVIGKNDSGHITALNWNNWSKKAKEQYMDAAQRDEAQRLQQTFAGEAPAYYNIPLMNLLFQFREVPLVAQNKQLARSIMFADKEAVCSLMLNFAIAGMVRFGWVGGMGYAKALVEGETDTYQLPGLERLDVMRYIAAGGLYPDAVTMVNSGFQAYNQQDGYQLARELPAMGLLKDAKDFALGNNEVNTRAEALQGLVPLGNAAYMDIIHTMFVKNINEMATFKEGEE